MNNNDDMQHTDTQYKIRQTSPFETPVKLKPAKKWSKTTRVLFWTTSICTGVIAISAGLVAISCASTGGCSDNGNATPWLLMYVLPVFWVGSTTFVLLIIFANIDLRRRLKQKGESSKYR